MEREYNIPFVLPVASRFIDFCSVECLVEPGKNAEFRMKSFRWGTKVAFWSFIFYRSNVRFRAYWKACQCNRKLKKLDREKLWPDRQKRMKLDSRIINLVVTKCFQSVIYQLELMWGGGQCGKSISFLWTARKFFGKPLQTICFS